MKALSDKQFSKTLEHHGWHLVRVSGSHHVYMKPGNPTRISLPVHGKEDLKIGLLKHFMKVAGISENEL